MEERYLRLSAWEKRKRRKQGLGNFLYARYSDDFVVLCNGPKRQAQSLKEELHTFLKTLKLTLSLEKTKVTHITDGFHFLGFWLERSIGTKGKMVPKVRIPQGAIRKFRAKILEATAPGTTKDSVKAKIEALNRIIRGWCQYYQYTGSPSAVFRPLRKLVFWRMAHWLGRKYKVRMPAVMQRFRQGDTFGTTTSQLVLPTDIKAKVYRWKPRPNPYTLPDHTDPKREAVFSLETVWLGKETRAGKMDLREQILSERGTTCAHCGEPFRQAEVDVDHVKPRAHFKRPTEADVPTNLQVLCKGCHMTKTQSDQRVLSRMRSKPHVRF